MEGLRAQDVAEVTASGERDATSALVLSVLQSDPYVFTILAYGVPCAIFGVAGSGEDELTGHPWMLGTDRTLSIARDLIVQTPYWVEFLSRIYPRLTNLVSKENTVSLRWLARMGFEFGEDVDVNGTPFVEFHNV